MFYYRTVVFIRLACFLNVTKLFSKKLYLALLSPVKTSYFFHNDQSRTFTFLLKNQGHLEDKYNFWAHPLLCASYIFAKSFFKINGINGFFISLYVTSLHLNNCWFYIELVGFFILWADFVCTREILCGIF